MEMYNMPLTLEKHFENLKETYPDVKELYNLWHLLRKKVTDQLIYSQNIFVHYSFHDGSHSRAVLQMIERFLGDTRISRLSATDTFMLLACSYVHDYGMAQTFNKVYDILQSPNFSAFLKEMEEKSRFLEEEDSWAVGNLLKVIQENQNELGLGEIYLSLMLALQMYLRPEHWKGVIDVEKDMHGLFEGNIKQRFVHGLEGIVEICKCHGQPVEELLKLSPLANGMVGDDYHPCFIAAMLRLGDLLDMDNERFPRWFVDEIAKGRNVIPKLSFLHYRKHEAVHHLLIMPDRIEITAECGQGTIVGESENERERREKEAYDVASLLAEWKDWILDECQDMAVHWNEIAPLDFGRPPGNVTIQIFVNGFAYTSQKKHFQMQMPHERVMELLEGTSIYQDKFVGIREMIQNAVDASLLQLWNDVLHNRYFSYDIFKDKISSHLDLLDFLQDENARIFQNYDITVEVVQLMDEGKVIVVVKDKGIGIMPEDMEFISNIGSSKEKNERLNRVIRSMPVWLKPSGVFGIGLQSVFQLTDCIEFYTRQHNMLERKIMLHSYEKNQGRIEVREIPPHEGGIPFHDNAVPGTNVVIVVEPRKLYGEKGGKNHFVYYDLEFDQGDALDMLFAEMSQACLNIVKSWKSDYFNIYFHSFKTGKDAGEIQKKFPCIRRSYFCPKRQTENYSGQGLVFGDTLFSLARRIGPYSFTKNMAWYWDKESFRAYRLKVRPCKITEDKNTKKEESEEANKDTVVRYVRLPERTPNLYNIIYKFNPIRNAETIYSQDNLPRHLHAGFLSLEVLILDDQPTKYLNIDRERLKKGSIDEENLLAVRRKILQEWCKYFSDQNKKKSNQTINEEEKMENQFRNMPETLLSLALLFYQNVSRDEFLRFITPYKDFLKSQNLYLEKGVLFTSLWEENKLFQIRYPDLFVPIRQEAILTKESEKAKEEEWDESKAVRFSQETVQCLPHRLIHLRKISCSKEAELVYLFELRTQKEEIKSVDLSQNARLYDYAMALESYTDKPVKTNKKTDEPIVNFNYFSLQKKLFKPDSHYKELLLPCYPKNYIKGNNFNTSIDHCFTWYLLSPFDQDMGLFLKNALKDKKESLEEFLDNIKNIAKESRQLKKCVDYILKKRYSDHQENQPDKESLRQKYIEFTENLCKLLYENQDWLEKQFLKRFD